MLSQAGLELADPNSFSESRQELVLGDGLHAIVYWTADQRRAQAGAVIGFRWQEHGKVDEEQAMFWFAKTGARLLKGLILPQWLARRVAGAKDHGWAASAAMLVEAVQQQRPGERIVFTGGSLGAVTAQLMSTLYSRDDFICPAVAFGGNGVREVLDTEGGRGPFEEVKRDRSEFRKAFHPYIYNFVDPGDYVPRLDCQIGTVCVAVQSAAAGCAEGQEDVTASRAVDETACDQCKTHVAFFLGDGFLNAFNAQHAKGFGCVAGPTWKGSQSWCQQTSTKVAELQPLP